MPIMGALSPDTSHAKVNSATSSAGTVRPGADVNLDTSDCSSFLADSRSGVANL